MTWCSKCGAPGDRVRLFDAISDKGIVKICPPCLSHENWPVVKKPGELYSKKPAQQPILSRDLPVRMGHDSRAMFNRLSRISGVVMSERREENPQMMKQNRQLKEIANRNFESKLMKERGNTSDLIENFNWTIMRARRAQHLSHEQLATAIGESEIAIKRAEQGILPSNSSPLIRKIENHLKIHLFKKDSSSQIQPHELRFDSGISKSLTISDLKSMKKDEPKYLESDDSLGNFEPDEDFEDKEKNEGKELSDEEVDDILFGKK